MWVLVLILVVLVLFLGLGYARLLSAFKGFAGADSKETSKREGVRLTSQLSKRIGRLDQAGQ